MDYLKINKGHDFQIAGKPSNNVAVLPDPDRIALVPQWLPFIKPRLKVAEGDRVRIGSVLFEDKRNPAFVFCSPAAGKVSRIEIGPRRVVQAIVINRDTGHEDCVDLERLSAEALQHIERKDLIQKILQSGLWWVFRELPLRDMPSPDAQPPMIIVSFDAKEPFQPDPAVYLQDQTDLFTYGLKVLERLAPGKVVVFTGAHNQLILSHYSQWITHSVKGCYPADDPGTVHYHLKHSAAENRAWFTIGQDLLLLAQLLAQGKYPTRRIVAVGGSAAPVRQHYQVRIGVPLAQLVDPSSINEPVRYVVGGLMQGFASDADGFMGLRETSLAVIPQGRDAEFMALFKPGAGKPSYSRAFVSKLGHGPLAYNCNLNGSQRACIACMHCADVCPVDILPQMTYKAILAEEVEEYLAHGLLDCVECGLCSYVCPSKIELSQTFKATKTAYAKEQAASS